MGFTPLGQYTPAPNVQTASGVGGGKVGESATPRDVTASQDKLKIALVDSGMGGGMTAAFLKGEVRQLGSYFCLPIGDKQPAVAEAYTAAMALWPLIMPLADDSGAFDGRVAENVIIACNSASVRKEGAVALMVDFVLKAEKTDFREIDVDGERLKIPERVKQGLTALRAAVQKQYSDVSKGALTNYFKDHVKEIVSITAERGAQEAVDLLHARRSELDPLLIRIDSTNGTAGSRSYPEKMLDALNRMQGVADAKSLANVRTATVGEPSYTITHDVIALTIDGKERTLVIEGRGNPPWVGAIEAGEKDKKPLVEESNAKSAEALKNAIDNVTLQDGNGETAKEALTALQSRERKPPDLTMLCCTHYPAMTAALKESYGADATFLNQATVVEEIVNQLGAENSGPLRLVLTVGSMNYGGAPGTIRPSIADGKATAEALGKVLEQTMNSQGSNAERSLGSVKVFAQGGRRGATQMEIDAYDKLDTHQRSFELLHRMMVTADKARSRFYADQNLKDNPSFTPGSDEPPFLFAANERRTKPVQPNLSRLSNDARDIMEKLDGGLGRKLGRLGVLMTLGETRGIDRIAPLNDQGAQLTAATAHLMDVIKSNEEKEEGAKQRVGILTGFTVVDADRKRVQGENDGPPGAVIMGKAIAEQGSPVVFVTDHSAEASLVCSLVGGGLAEIKPGSINKLWRDLTAEDVEPVEGVPIQILIADVQVPAEPPKALSTDNPGERARTISKRHEETRGKVLELVGKLQTANVGTMISIERPSVTQLDGGIYSMIGVDVAPYNPDLSPALGFFDKEDFKEGPAPDFRPFTIGIGDGGNELGTGGIQFMTAEGRDHKLLPFVHGGSVIGASTSRSTDVMLLSSVSNNGGVAVAMALQAGLAGEKNRDLETKLTDTIIGYNEIIVKLHENGMSIDGVNKKNLLTVDGRALGEWEDPRQPGDKTAPVPPGVEPSPGAVADGKPKDGEHTHNDTFLKFWNALRETPAGRQL